MRAAPKMERKGVVKRGEVEGGGSGRCSRDVVMGRASA